MPLPATPPARSLGFHPLPAGFVAALGGYLALVEVGKRIFYGAAAAAPGPRRSDGGRHPRRRAAYFSTANP